MSGMVRMEVRGRKRRRGVGEVERERPKDIGRRRGRGRRRQESMTCGNLSRKTQQRKPKKIVPQVALIESALRQGALPSLL